MVSSVFVPGKVIISGEHSVVYGKLALAASVGMGVRVRVKDDFELHGYNKIVEKAVSVAGGSKNLKVTIESELPIGSGMGSSAAVAAATIKAVREYLGNPIQNDELFGLAMECEKIAHGSPSGVDPAAVIYGGLIAYIKGKPFEMLKIATPLTLLLIDSGKPSESTSQMVQWVAQQHKKDELVEEMGEVAQRVKNALEHGDDIALLIDKNGLLLEQLGVVGSRAKTISYQLRNLGYAVKITGAGGIKTGSGMMIVVGDDFSQAKKLLDSVSIHYFETTIGEI